VGVRTATVATLMSVVSFPRGVIEVLIRSLSLPRRNHTGLGRSVALGTVTFLKVPLWVRRDAGVFWF
jgi:hypothetical protein